MSTEPTIKNLIQILDIYVKSKQIVQTIAFDENLIAGNGKIIEHEKTDPDIIIGIRDINEKSLNDKIHLIKSVFHELRHVEQIKYNFTDCFPDPSEFRIDHAASYANNDYYGISKTEQPSERYFKNIREMEAEHSAVIETYALLSNKNLFPEIDDPEKTIIKFLNYNYCQETYFGHKMHGPYYLTFTKPLTSLEEYEKKYQTQLKNAMYGKCGIYYRYTGFESETYAMIDMFPEKFTGVKQKLFASSDMPTRRHMNASLATVLYPELEKPMTEKDLKAIDFESLFKIPKPEIPETAVGKIKSMAKKQNEIKPESEAMRKLNAEVRKTDEHEDITATKTPSL